MIAIPILADDPIAGLMSDVRQWVELQDAIHRERVEWERTVAKIGQQIELLEKEKALLSTQIEEALALSDDATESRVTQEERFKAQERAFEKLETHWKEIQPLIQEARSALPSHFTDSPAGTLNDRYAAFFAMAVQVQRHGQAIHHESRLLTQPDGSRRLMDILQFGHALAYAVSPDDQSAAFGVWSGSDWEWSWNSAWAPTIRTALRIHRGESAPRWVSLPFQALEDN